MNIHETYYQITAIILMVIGMSISFYFRSQAARSGDKINSAKEEGILLLALRSLFGLALWLSTLAYLINPRWMTWSSLPLPGWARWDGGRIDVGLLAVDLLAF